MLCTKAMRPPRRSATRARPIFKFVTKGSQSSQRSASSGAAQNHLRKPLISFWHTSHGATRRLLFWFSTRTKTSAKFSSRSSRRCERIPDSFASRERKMKRSTSLKSVIRIIEREVAIVSPEALGRTLTAIVEVTLDTDGPKAVEEFQRALPAMPEGIQGYSVNRNADFILIVPARSGEDSEDFASRSLSKTRY